MLRPEKDEGERPAKSYNSIKKAPLIFTTALLIGYPLCLGQAALASTSSFGLHSQQDQSRTALNTRSQSLPKNYLDLRLHSLSTLPSDTQISNLESILSDYKSKLTTIRNQAADRPDLDLSQAIDAIQSDIDTLTQRIVTLKSTLALYDEHKAALTEATQAYNSALAKQTDLATELESVTAARDSLLNKSALAAQTLAAANQDVTNTAQALADAKAAVLAATAENASATAILNQARQDKTSANQTLTQATSSLASAVTRLTTAQSRYDSAVQALTQATSNAGTSSSTLAQLTTEASQAQATLSSAQSTYDQASISLLEAQASKLSADQDVIQAVASLAQTSNTITQAEQDLAQANTLLDETTANRDAASTSFWQLQSELGPMHDQISAAESQLAAANTNYQNSTASLGQASHSLQTAQDDYAQVLTAQQTTSQQLTTASQVVADAEAFFNTQYQIYQNMLVNYQQAQADKDSSYNTWQEAQTNLNSATDALSQAQSNYDTQLIPGVNETATQYGITARVYNNLNSSNPQRSDTAYNLCLTTNLTNIQANWGGGTILGCGNDRVMIHYTGYITPTENVTYLMNQADDGFYMSIDGNVVINNWTLKGCGGNWNSTTMLAGHTYVLDAWFYEWGGGACSTLYYQSNNNWGVVPAAWYSTNQPAQMLHDPALLAILNTKQDEYNVALDARDAAHDSYLSYEANFLYMNAHYNDYANAVNEAGWAWQDAGADYSNAVQANYSATQELAQAQLAVDQAQATYDQAVQGQALALQAIADATPLPAIAQANYDELLARRNTAWEDYGVYNNAATRLLDQISNYESIVANSTVDETQKEQDLAGAIALAATAETSLTDAQAVLETTSTNLDLVTQTYSQAQEDLAGATANASSDNLALAAAQQESTDAATELAQLQVSHDSSIQSRAQATLALATANQNLTDAETTAAKASAKADDATENLSDASNASDDATANLVTANTQFQTVEANLVQAETVVVQATDSLTTATTETATRKNSVSDAENTVSTTESTAKSDYESVQAIVPDFASIETKLATPKPMTEETGSKEIPAELSAENLMSVDLEKVDPTELTSAQADQLKEAALETFETAVAGSPEYEQALGALFLAAQQDDIELSPELAAIPGLAAAAELVNFLGNAGADMSPKVRAESKKIVVTAVVAAGVAVQAAAGAATSAAAGASAGASGGSGSVRRKTEK